MNRVVSFIGTFCNIKNIFELLILEYMNQISEESLEELSTSLKPAFQIDLPTNLTNYYNEFDVLFCKQKLTFILYYKKSDDSFNVSFKQNFEGETSLLSKTLTYLSIVKFGEAEQSKSNTNKPSNHFKFNILNHTKTQYNIYHHISFSNFLKRESSNGKKTFSLVINMKINLIHSAITWYIINNYHKYSRDPNVIKLSKQTIQVIIKSRPKCSEQEILISFMNWRNISIN